MKPVAASRDEGEPGGVVEEELVALGRLMSRPLDGREVAQHLQEVSQHIVDGLRRLLGAVGCSLYGIESAAGPDLKRPAASPSREIAAYPVGDDAAGRALRERRVGGGAARRPR